MIKFLQAQLIIIWKLAIFKVIPHRKSHMDLIFARAYIIYGLKSGSMYSVTRGLWSGRVEIEIRYGVKI